MKNSIKEKTVTDTLEGKNNFSLKSFLSQKSKEIILGVSLVSLFIVYYFNLLNDGMMVSGIITLVIALYTVLIWQEKIYDERDEYIRSKVDRYLYVSTSIMLMIDIVYKTFTHTSYVPTLLILCALYIIKIFLSRFIKDNI